MTPGAGIRSQTTLDMFTFSSGFKAATLRTQAGGRASLAIRFVKFHSRGKALAARDLLQGRRVDNKKGTALRVEMAKKDFVMVI